MESGGISLQESLLWTEEALKWAQLKRVDGCRWVDGCKDYGSLLLASPPQTQLLGKIPCVYTALCLRVL